MGFIASPDFSHVTSFKVGEDIPTHGFSSFKFIPGRKGEVVALKTVEYASTVEAYMMVFQLQSREVLMQETRIGDKKFEGVEFLPRK